MKFCFITHQKEVKRKVKINFFWKFPEEWKFASDAFLAFIMCTSFCYQLSNILFCDFFSLSAKYCLVSFNKELLFVCLYYLYCGGSQTCVINCLIWKLKFFLFFLFTVERFQTFILETNFVHFESKAFEQT